MDKKDEIIQALILKVLEEHPKGLTTRQIQREVRRKIKKMQKISKLLNEI